MELKLLAISCFLLVAVASAQTLEDENPNRNYTLNILTWTSKKRDETGVSDNGCHRRPVVRGTFSVSVQTTDGKIAEAGKTRCPYHPIISNRVNHLQVLLPRDLRTVKSLTLKYDRQANSTEGAILNVVRLRVSRLFPPVYAVYTRGNQTRELQPGVGNEFRPGYFSSFEDDWVDDAEELGGNDVVDDEEIDF